MKQSEQRVTQITLMSTNLLYTMIRLILGTIILSAVVFSLRNHPEHSLKSGLAARVVNGLWDTGYIMQMVKVIEFAFGISLITNQYVKLACVLYAPVIVNIVLYDVFADNPRGLLIAIPLLLLTITIMRINFQTYRGIFARK